MKKTIIVGAGGFGRELVQIIKDINKETPTYNIIGFIDDNDKALDDYKSDYKIIGKIREWKPSEDEVYVCAIANPEIKKKIVCDLVERGACFETIIHPNVLIGDFSSIGKGCVLYPNAKITVNVAVGDYVTILGSSIGHDVVIGNYSTITGTCAINGKAQIGESVFVGSGAVVAPSKKVGDNAYICSGSIVLTNVKKGTKVIGNPARRFKL